MSSIKDYLKKILKKLFYFIGNSPIKCSVYLTIFISLFLFDSFWTSLINKIWVNPIASQIKENSLLVIPYLIIISTYYYIRKWKIVNDKYYIIPSLCIIYLICRLSGKWEYVPICDSCSIAWSDLFFVVVPICEACWRCKLKDTNKKITPKLEYEQTDNVSDSYKRREVCKSVHNILQSCFYEEGSFTFSITGSWGSGKTTFINMLKEGYNKDNSVSVIVFEPWKNDTPHSIVNAFFKMLDIELSNYIPNISYKIQEYAKLLLDKEVPYFIKIIGKYLSESNKENPYELIKNKLKETKHKIVVFIDDIDRMKESEIKEILRLIRNTGNFPYMQYILAYDKKYVCETLSNSGIKNPDLYLEKFINVELNLPKIEERVICNELLNRIKSTIHKIWGLKEEDPIIADMVYYRPKDNNNSILDCFLIPRILHTNRDVIRFHNSFSLLTHAYKDQNSEKELNFQDLFFLELLKFKYHDIYTIICNRPFDLLQLTDDMTTIEKFDAIREELCSIKEPTKNSFDYVLSLKKDHKKTLEKYIGSSNTELEIVIAILEYLFRKNKTENSISNLRRYNQYFIYRTDDKILTINEVMSLSELSESELIKSAKELYDTKYPNEFNIILGTMLSQIYTTDVDNRTIGYTKVYSIVRNLMRGDILKDEISKATIPHIQEMKLIDTRHLKEILELFDSMELSALYKDFNGSDFLESILLVSKFEREYDIKKLTEIVSNFLSNTPHTVFISSRLRSFIEKRKNEDDKIDDLLITLDKLSDIQLKYFENIEDKLSEDGLRLFRNCIDLNYYDSYNIILREEALKIMYDAIKINPEKYFKQFIKHIEHRINFIMVWYDEFCDQIFNSISEFETFLNNLESTAPYIDKVKKYWKLYKQSGNYGKENYLTIKVPHGIKIETPDDFLNAIDSLIEYLR